MRTPIRTPAHPVTPLLEALESRLLLTNVYAVQLTSPGAGVHGQAGCSITSGQLQLNSQYTPSGSTTAYVAADSAAQAVQRAVTGSVTVNSGVLNYGGNGYKGFNDWADQTYTFDPTHSVTDPGVHQQDVAFYISPDGSKIGLEDLAHYPTRSDWDWNTAGVDDYWNVTTTQVTLNSLTVEDSLHPGTGVDANDTTPADVYIEENGTGADVNLSISSDPTTKEAQQHILYAVTPSASAAPAVGHFANGSNFNTVHLDTSTGNHDFMVQAGVDLDLNGTLDPSEVTRTVNVNVRPPQINVTVSLPQVGINQMDEATATLDDLSPDVPIQFDVNGQAFGGPVSTDIAGRAQINFSSATTGNFTITAHTVANSAAESQAAGILVTGPGLNVESKTINVGDTQPVKVTLLDNGGAPAGGISLQIGSYDATIFNAQWDSNGNVTDANGQATILLTADAPGSTVFNVADTTGDQGAATENASDNPHRSNPAIQVEARPENTAQGVSPGDQVILHVTGRDEDQISADGGSTWKNYPSKAQHTINFSVGERRWRQISKWSSH